MIEPTVNEPELERPPAVRGPLAERVATEAPPAEEREAAVTAPVAEMAAELVMEPDVLTEAEMSKPVTLAVLATRLPRMEEVLSAAPIRTSLLLLPMRTMPLVPPVPATKSMSTGTPTEQNRTYHQE